MKEEGKKRGKKKKERKKGKRKKGKRKGKRKRKKKRKKIFLLFFLLPPCRNKTWACLVGLESSDCGVDLYITTCPQDVGTSCCLVVCQNFCY